ncbi:hypothetical protein JZX87_10960 [Agrobacterium sp. Ap1]|uniref:NACHT domain-containing protein n=1 Tax=Agrobacterium sp. Ap1 TaxID=2815337 RepID=UPI001A8D4FAB|nr:hypothetical protein [Agrobacterium sp. Ap1]MBO0141678.1 hypothetical protein [Agrobacterium sp. Ap1]
MSVSQLESMIGRMRYDETDKAIFVKKIKSGLFETHESLLSNPLLASMMLLTFKEFQDVPSKMHVFYCTAFDVLYRKHDATKPEYSRDFKSSLEQDDFRKVFTAFCFYSYLDDYYSFKMENVLHYVSGAAEQEEIEVSPSDYYYDLKNNMCIMQEEGDDINFIHRSFQEYFSAIYLSRKSIDDNEGFIDEIISTRGRSSAIDMLISIDRQEFERKYFLAKMAEVCDDLNGMKTFREKLDFFMPLLVFRKMKDEFVCDTRTFSAYSGSALTKILISHYKLNFLEWDKYKSKNWYGRLPKSLSKMKDGDVEVMYPIQLPVYLLKALGLDKYVSDLVADTKDIRDEIVGRHESKKKSRLMLRRNKSDIIGVN